MHPHPGQSHRGRPRSGVGRALLRAISIALGLSTFVVMPASVRAAAPAQARPQAQGLVDGAWASQVPRAEQVPQAEEALRADQALQAEPASQAEQASAAQANAKAEQARIQAELVLVRAAAKAIAHGRRAEAESLARASGTEDGARAAVLGRLLAERGQYDQAEALLQPGAAKSPVSDAALVLGLLLQTRGRKAEASRALAPLVNASRGAVGAESLLRSARAARALDQTRSANALFRDAAAAAKNDPGVNTAWGELFLEKHDPANAAKSFRIAIQGDIAWAPAHAGLARALADEDPPAAAASASRAIEIDPNLIDAHLFLAESALDREHTAEAKAAIGRALAINPRSPEAHSLAAAMAYVSGRTTEYEAAVGQALSVNPIRGDTYRAVAAHAAGNYRFDEAVSLAQKAIALEPDNVRAHADLGMHLLRAGDEREARRVLEIAFRADSYDLVTHNLLTMLDNLYEFESVKTGNVIVRLHPDEAPVLRLYAVPLIEQAMAEMRARYQVDPKGPIVVEVFPKHDDFAVRTLGLPGMIGALGACFGRVVTQDSPRARPPGSFNWQATMWHELAHVFSLQLSNQRVPRWVTEGMSVYEEGRRRPEWARDSEVAFARAYAEGRVAKLADLNAAFTRPDTVELAYFQASLVVSLVVDRYGEDALRVMLRAFAGGSDTEAALRLATRAGVAELQTMFNESLEKRFAAIGRALVVPEGVDVARGADQATLQALATKHRGSYPVQMAVGQALAAAGAREAALAVFEQAAALVPIAIGPDSPRARIADIAERSGNFERALQELKSLVAADHTNVDAARKLAPLARRLGDQDAQLLAYERIVTIDPFDAAAHTSLGRLAIGRRDLTVAVREFRAALAAGPVDVAPAHCDLSEALLMNGQLADAKKEVLAALEIAPTYARAQELLLKIVDGRE